MARIQETKLAGFMKPFGISGGFLSPFNNDDQVKEAVLREVSGITGNYQATYQAYYATRLLLINKFGLPASASDAAIRNAVGKALGEEARGEFGLLVSNYNQASQILFAKMKDGFENRKYAVTDPRYSKARTTKAIKEGKFIGKNAYFVIMNHIKTTTEQTIAFVNANYRP